MKIAMGSDHAGYELKEYLKEYLKSQNYEIVDCGTDSKESVDYPLFGFKVGKLVSQNKVDKGIVICGTGIGISIACNKVKGVRCALVHDVTTAKYTRLHNDANCLAMGGQIVGKLVAKDIVDTWLKTDFEKGRHERRINLIKEFEENE